MKGVIVYVAFLLTGCASNSHEHVEIPLSTGLEMTPINFVSARPAAGESLMNSVDKFSRGGLQRDLGIVKRYGSVQFEILGFTDNVECEEKACEQLAKRRADSVYSWLVANGVSAASIVAVSGKGADAPIGDNSTEEGRAINRRVEINVIPLKRSSRP